MSYFEKYHRVIRYPHRSNINDVGLRRAQFGALGAINAHFSLKTVPAVVIMPTGTGKTAVLMISAFAQRAKRVLVVTPSRLVRAQIVEEFSTLSTLRRIQVIPANIPNPTVVEIGNRISSANQWHALEEYDVIVSTPNSISPALEGVAEPPEDLFDLLLIDEAHHSPARTWRSLIESFPVARKVLFTATPFRRDKKEIKGDFIYEYPLKEAYNDGIYGKINFLAVHPNDSTLKNANDIAIAKSTEEKLKEDRSQGLEHFVMVRTDYKTRAKELKVIYEEHTDLNLRVVNSDHSYSHIKRTIRYLREGKLDGIICVDMLGEGFDLPNLKIAAIHAPHKSLEVTLQFIGRFARTKGENIGGASFLAVPSEIEIETERLFDEQAVWQEIIPNLSQARIDHEVKVRRAINTFNDPEISILETQDLSLYALRPFSHVRIYQVYGEEVDLATPYKPASGSEIIYHQYSPELSASILILRSTTVAKWTTLDLFDSTKYTLVVLYYHAEQRLLFVNSSSTKSDNLYSDIIRQVAGGSARPIPISKTQKVSVGLDGVSIYHAGLRKSSDSASGESYRTYTGPDGGRAITQSDTTTHHKGHAFMGAREDGKKVTIGYSASAKVWSLKYSQIPVFIDWCQKAVQKLSGQQRPTTGSAFDNLPVAEEISSFPDDVIGVRWNDQTYVRSPVVRYTHSESREEKEIPLILLDIEVRREESDRSNVILDIRGDGLHVAAKCSLSALALFSKHEGQDAHVSASSISDWIDLVRYLENFPPALFTADFSRVEGRELLSRNPQQNLPFDINEQVETIDWEAENVDIQNEIESTSEGPMSIHDYLIGRLSADTCNLVIYDHGNGEVADLVTVTSYQDRVLFELYHCKKSGDTKAGERVDDVYEVVGQVVKSMKWIRTPRAFLDKIDQRERRNSNFRYVKGDGHQKDVIANVDIRRKPSQFRINLVQPGISKSKITDKIANNLAAADSYLRTNDCLPMRVIASE